MGKTAFAGFGCAGCSYVLQSRYFLVLLYQYVLEHRLSKRSSHKFMPGLHIETKQYFKRSIKMNNIEFDRVYDLSIPVYSDMQLHPAEAGAGVRSRVLTHGFPMHMPSMANERGGPKPGWPIFHDLILTTHTGTHVDGSWHFNQDGKRIDEWPLEKFMGKAVVLDFRHLEDCYSIQAGDLDKASSKIEEGDILIINTGRHKDYGTPAYTEKHPGIDGNSCKEFILDKKIKMIGLDTICVEPCSEQSHWEHALHRVCLIENEIPLIENLGGEIDELAGKRCYVMALPLKLRADSGLARVIALA